MELTVLLTTLSIITIRLRFIFYHCTESSRALEDQDDTIGCLLTGRHLLGIAWLAKDIALRLLGGLPDGVGAALARLLSVGSAGRRGNAQLEEAEGQMVAAHRLAILAEHEVGGIVLAAPTDREDLAGPVLGRRGDGGVDGLAGRYVGIGQRGSACDDPEHDCNEIPTADDKRTRDLLLLTTMRVLCQMVLFIIGVLEPNGERPCKLLLNMCCVSKAKMQKACLSRSRALAAALLGRV